MRQALRGLLIFGLMLLCGQAYAQSTFLRDDGTFAQVATTDLSGTATCAFLPALTGDITSTAATCATSLASAITFTGKTLTGGNVNALTTLSLRDTGAAFNLSFISTITGLSANRSITWDTQNGSRTISLAGNLTLAGSLTTSGASALTLTTAGVTNSTLPAGSHTLAGLDVIQTWSANQTFNSGNFLLAGSSSGSLTIKPAAAAGANTLTLPAGTTDFSATGGTSQVVKQTTSGGAFTVARLACADLSDAGTGCAGSSAIVVGTTVVSSGTTTRILYDNAGVVGEYTLTGSGTVVAMQTAPTFVTSATVPLVIGGTAVGSSLILESTSGVGSSDTILFKTGSQATAGTVATGGQWALGTQAPISSLIPLLDLNQNTGSPANPSTTLAPNLRAVSADGASSAIEFQTYSNGVAGVTGLFRSYASGGIRSSQSALATGVQIFNISAMGWDGTNWGSAATGNNPDVRIRFQTDDAFTTSAHGTHIDFSTTPTGTIVIAEAMRIQPSGGISIGTTTDLGIGTVLANGAIKTLSTTVASSKTTGSGIFGGGIGVAGATYTDTLNVITMASTAQTNVVCYNTSTGLTTYQTWATGCLSSSERFKNVSGDIEPARALQIATSLLGKRYRYKTDSGLDDGDDHIGFIAEEVAQIEPLLATPDAVKYQEFAPIWAGAIQQLKLDNDDLRARIEQLERVAR